MKQIANASLQSFNTFGFEAVCKTLYHIQHQDDLDALSAFTADTLPFIIGAGSNLLLMDTQEKDFLSFSQQGWSIISESETDVEIKVNAGHNWHQLVLETAEKGWWGIENLALIPGLVGAAPVQNIGAYGVEVKDVISSVDVFDLLTKEHIQLNTEQAEFAYRDSIFKRPEHKSWLVTAVSFRLSKLPKPILGYGPLSDLNQQAAALTSLKIANRVMQIRRSKLPDIDEVGSAGSFFKNPIVDADTLEKVKVINPEVVFYPYGQAYKIAAGWLIDSLGFKGARHGNIGVYPKQALVLVHYFKEGVDSAKAIDQLALDIAAKVVKVYGIALEREVITL